MGLNRLGASLLILIAFALGVAIVLVLVAPILSNQFVAFSQRLPDYAVRLQALAVDEGNVLIAKYGGGWLHALGLSQPLSAHKFIALLAISSLRAHSGFSTP